MLKLIKENHSKIFIGRDYRWHSLYLCSYCGKEVLRILWNVSNKKIKSCGCLKYHKHGYLKHPLYLKYNGMYARCYNSNVDGFENYGGRGIYIYPEWKHNPIAFVQWGLANGWSNGLQIDRIDNDGPYSPNNCRFVTQTENIQNCRATKLTISNVKLIRERLNEKETYTDIAKDFNVNYSTISRIDKGKTWKNI